MSKEIRKDIAPPQPPSNNLNLPQSIGDTYYRGSSPGGTLEDDDSVRARKQPYKRFVFANQADQGSNVVMTNGLFYQYTGSTVANQEASSLGMFHIQRTNSSLAAASVIAGVTGGNPTNGNWQRSTHYFYRPFTFAAMVRLDPSSFHVSGKTGGTFSDSGGIIGVGDPIYVPSTAETASVPGDQQRHNLTAIFWGTDLAATAINRGEDADVVQTGSLGVTLTSDTDYLAIIHANSTNVEYQLVNPNSGATLGSVTLSYASDQELNTAPGVGSTEPLYPLIFVENLAAGGLQYIGHYWYGFEDNMNTIPTTVTIFESDVGT